MSNEEELKLNSKKLINSINSIKQSHTMKLIFTHCYDDCLYIYYTFFESNTVVCEFEIHLMVVCIKTFNVLINRKFFDDQTIADIDWNDYDERFSDIKIMSMTLVDQKLDDVDWNGYAVKFSDIKISF